MREIWSLSDLAQLDEAELLACCRALRGAIRRARSEHAKDVREGRIRPGSPVQFESFVWIPRGLAGLGPARIRPETPLDDLALRSEVRDALGRLHIFCVEDLAHISERELLETGAIGAMTVARLRAAVEALGMSFLAADDGART